MTDLSLQEYNQQQADAMAEIPLQKVIIAFAKRHGWKVYFTYISKGSAAGYPDLHLVHPERKLSLFREIKTSKGKTTDKQDEWLAALTAAGHDVAVWRPIDWFDGTIDQQLIEVNP